MLSGRLFLCAAIGAAGLYGQAFTESSVVTGQENGPRQVQLGLKIVF